MNTDPRSEKDQFQRAREEAEHEDSLRYTINHTNKDWTEDFEYENGNYENQCTICHETFYGHKRRVACRKCSYGLTEKEVRRILGDWVQEDNELHNLSPYVSYPMFDNVILDGEFTSEELKAIAWWMENKDE